MSFQGFQRRVARPWLWLFGLVGMGLALNLGCNSSSGPSAGGAGERAVSTFTASRILGVPSNRCVDVAAVSTENGAPVLIWDCNGGPNQSWTYDGARRLVVYGNKCLQPSNGGTAIGTELIIWDCNGQPYQQWNLNSDGSISSAQAGLCMDAHAAATANGTRVIIWTCNGGSNQKWTVPGLRAERGPGR